MNQPEGEEEFDQMWAEAVAQNYHIEVPDSSASWNRVAKILAKEQARRRRSKRIRTAAVVAASLAIGAALVSVPGKGSASNPITAFVKNLQGDVTTLFYGSSKGKEDASTSPPPVEGEGGDQLVAASLQEARERSPFPFVEPQTLPAGYAFEAAFLAADGKEIGGVVLEYKKGSDRLVITERPFPPNSVLPRPAKATTIRLGGADAYVSEEADGRVTVSFASGAASIRMTATISPDQLAETAGTMLRGSAVH